MSEQRKGPLWDAIRLAAEGAPIQDIIKKASQAKLDIVASMQKLLGEVALLDNLVAHIAPNIPWERGMVAPSQTTAVSPSTRQVTPDRNRRALEIAKSMLADGTKRVKAKDVAEILQSEGFAGSVRILSISAGNTLHRAEGWHRVRQGEYEYQD